MKDIITRRINEENKTARRYILDRVTMALSPQVEVSPCAAPPPTLPCFTLLSRLLPPPPLSLQTHSRTHVDLSVRPSVSVECWALESQQLRVRLSLYNCAFTKLRLLLLLFLKNRETIKRPQKVRRWRRNNMVIKCTSQKWFGDKYV